jgi:D-tagatose-1,6-bisphosphate aldolase subunit GatZ/KbaZ
VIALVVQPGVEFGDDVVFAYRRAEAAGLKVLAETQEHLVYEAHSTDYQAEGALRALVADHYAILKVGPELTFAFREAVFSLEEIERELLGHRTPDRLSCLRAALDGAMRRDPRHWEAFYGGDEDEQRLRRAWSLSDRARYYWAYPEVAAALGRLFANLEARSLPQGLVSQYLPGAVDLVRETPARELPSRVARLHVRRVLQRYARACRPITAGVSDGRESP